MRVRNPWFEWMSFLVGLALAGAACGAVRDFCRGDRDIWEATSMVTMYVVLAVGAVWISLRLGKNQKRMRAWRWDEKLTDRNVQSQLFSSSEESK
jgi:hypothetical protein